MSTSPAPSARAELKALLRLAAPIAGTQLSFMAMGVTDTVMAAPLGELALSGLALGNTIFFFVGLFGMGVMMGLDALVSQAFGRGDARAAQASVRAALWLGLALGAVLGPVALAIPTVLQRLGYDPALADAAREYLRPLTPAVVPLLWFQAYRSALAAAGRTRPALVAALIGNVANIGLNLWFIDGGFGLPALGVSGIALSTCLCQWLQLGVVSWAYEVGQPLGATVLTRRGPEREALGEVLRIGLPIGGTLAAEVGCFSAATVLMGEVGERALAGHQIAMSISSVAFMVAMALGAAAAVRTGQAAGRGDGGGVRIAARVALAAGGVYSLVSATVMASAGAFLVGLYGPTPEVAVVAVDLLLFAAFFQVGDVAQAVASGALRGLGDTRVPLLMTLAGYWLVAVPTGAWLCFGLGLGARGLWIGLAMGLWIAAFALGQRLLRTTAAGARAVVTVPGLGESTTRESHEPLL